MAQRIAPTTQATEAQDKLLDIARRIEPVKAREYGRQAEDPEQQLREAQRRGGAEFEQLAARLRPLPEPPAG